MSDRGLPNWRLHTGQSYLPKKIRDPLVKQNIFQNRVYRLLLGDLGKKIVFYKCARSRTGGDLGKNSVLQVCYRNLSYGVGREERGGRRVEMAQEIDRRR